MTQKIYEKLQAIAKPYSVLYVEDDMAIQEVMSSILRSFCGVLYTATNGKEGLELFHSLEPDLIITDIAMPLMNGIEMIKAIRQSDKEIPIMVNSAFSDKEYLLDSIYMGINRYTIKPIRHEEFLENLLSLCTQLYNRDQAKIYAKIKLQEKINKASTGMLASVIQIYPNPTIIYTKEGKVQFANTAAVELFDLSLDDMDNLSEAINAMFIPKEGYISNLSFIEENTLNKNCVLIRTKIAKKIYIVNKRTVMSAEFGQLLLYAFTDITRVEYEKQKSQNLSLYLREKLRFGVLPTLEIQASREEKTLHVKVKNESKSYDEIRLAAMHYSQKISAQQYLAELTDDIFEELSELDELERDMLESVLSLEEVFSITEVHKLSYDFSKYAKTLSHLRDFEDVAFSLHKVSDFLFGLKNLDFKTRKMHLLLDGISEDLRNWRKMIFVTQEAQDIHYLDASLLSSCLQIEVEFGGVPLREEDELDLF